MNSTLTYDTGPMFLDALIKTLSGPITGATVNAGIGYSNTDSITFVRDASDPVSGNDAVATVVTDSGGSITGIDVTWGGKYTYPPAANVSTNTGSGGIVMPIVDCDSLYLTLGRTVAYSNESSPDPIDWSVQGSQTLPNQQLLFGQRLAANSFVNAVQCDTWSSGQTWAVYDDADSTLSSKSFYCVTGDGNVFKCIRNGANAISTIEPANTTPTSFPEILSDGYQWLFMYTVPTTPAYSTTQASRNWVPVVLDANVAANALSGSVMHVVVEDGGTGYPASNGTVISSSGSSGKSFLLSGIPSAIPNYFAGCTLTAWNGSTPSNFVISTSGTDTGGNLLVQLVSAPSANQVAAGFPYQIAPSVQLVGDGRNFVAHATVSALNGSIQDVIITNPGQDFTSANAQLINAGGFGNNASIRAVISPGKGHGTDPAHELFCDSFLCMASLSNTEPAFDTSVLGTPIVYRSIGIVQNPQAFQSNGAAFTTAHFNQRVLLNVSGTGMWTVGESLTDPSTGSTMVVAAVNATSMQAEVVGVHSLPPTGEVLTGSTSGVSLTLNTIGSSGYGTVPDLELGSSDFIYLNNIDPTSFDSSNTITPIIRIVVTP